MSPSIMLMFAMMALFPTAARAQGAGFGYLIGAPMWGNSVGEHNFAWLAGVGGERVGGDGVGFGGEAGIVIFPATERTSPHVSGSSPSSYGALFSITGSYHLREHRLGAHGQPFVTGGLTLARSMTALDMCNVGGGADWWVTPHAGIRAEVRDQFLPWRSIVLGARVGVVFR